MILMISALQRTQTCAVCQYIIVVVMTMQGAWVDVWTWGGLSATYWQRTTVQSDHKDTERQSMYCFISCHTTAVFYNWMTDNGQSVNYSDQ